MNSIQNLNDSDIKEWNKLNRMIYIRDQHMLIKQDRIKGESVDDRRWRLAFVLLSGCGLQIYLPGTTTKQLVHEIFMDFGITSSPLIFIPFEMNTRAGISSRKKYFISIKSKVLTLKNCSEDTIYFLKPSNKFTMNNWYRTLKYVLQRYQEWYCRISKKYLSNSTINSELLHFIQTNKESKIKHEQMNSHNNPQIDTAQIKLSSTRSTNICDTDPTWDTPIDMINNVSISPISLKSCISDETEIILQNNVVFKDKIDIGQENLIFDESRSLPESNWMQFYQKRSRKNIKFEK